MGNHLIQTTVDPEELIDQYNWLCDAAILYNVADNEAGSEQIIGLQNLLEGMMQGLWGDVLIYDNGGETHDRYLVIMPGRNDTYYMSFDADMPNGVCTEGSTEGDLTWTKLDNGGGYMKEVSIIAVEPGVRSKILQLISNDLEYYEEYLVIT